MPRLRLRLLAALLAAATLACVATAALAAGRRYRNEAAGVGDFEVPRYWTLAPPSPYPGVLLVAVLPPEGSRRGPGAASDEARLLLAAQRVVPNTALDLAADARAQLERQGYTEPRVTPLAPGPGGEDRVRLDARTPSGRRLLRQVYIVDGDVLVVLTVLTPPSRQVRAFQDFDAALASLVVEPPSGLVHAPSDVPGPEPLPATDGGAPPEPAPVGPR